MNARNDIKALWEFLTDEFDLETIEDAFKATIKGFEFDAGKMKPSAIDELSDEEAKSLLFSISYMALNELFGGDWGTWDDILRYSLGFDDETLDFLNF